MSYIFLTPKVLVYCRQHCKSLLMIIGTNEFMSDRVSISGTN